MPFGEQCERPAGEQVLSVNEAIDRLDELDGSEVIVYGKLELEFEGRSLVHVPKPEFRGMQSQVWVWIDPNATNLTEKELMRFNHRHVMVQGRLAGPGPEEDGCGHMSLWPAELHIRSIVRWSLNDRHADQESK